ncbi:A-kinase anchor protein 7 isoforms alpha and beta [Liparis tanakae]|uniref:A-kinase anchor protein 7 isoforms alpha and beta n=1 Tax=Liparis tanakae TaxID=230148 RepID=A0A4Z2FPU3_9TELE|nr:A-kinase anchor protein 7 isoforms alpha and beta [Liparis tanakae]
MVEMVTVAGIYIDGAEGPEDTRVTNGLSASCNPSWLDVSGGRRRSEPDEAELLRVSRRLVEDAVNRAVQQYKQETLQNGGGPNATSPQPPGNTEGMAKTDAADDRK